MDNVKLSLKIILPGRVLMSEQECSKNPKEHYDDNSVKVIYFKKGKRINETISFKTRKCYNACKSINLTKEAYDYMTGKAKNRNEDAYYCPSWAIPQKWHSMSKEERLHAHLKRISEHFGGISYSYQILDD
jgi:hypothetical protein